MQPLLPLASCGTSGNRLSPRALQAQVHSEDMGLLWHRSNTL